MRSERGGVTLYPDHRDTEFWLLLAALIVLVAYVAFRSVDP